MPYSSLQVDKGETQTDIVCHSFNTSNKSKQTLKVKSNTELGGQVAFFLLTFLY